MQQDWHFPPETRAFLAGLRDNNRKDWFEAHRADYQSAFLAPAGACGDLLSAELSRLAGRPYRARLFRIYRDQRFSRGVPYKAHLHMLFEEIAPQGFGPALFFGLEPDGLFLGGGIFAFDAPALLRWRAEVAGPRGAELADLLATQQASGARLFEPELKAPPRGTPPDHPRAGLLRHKGLVLQSALQDGELAEDRGFVGLCRAEFARLMPVIDWLRSAG